MVAPIVAQEFRMVLIGIQYAVVSTETLIGSIVIGIDHIPVPIAFALDTKMIVGISSQAAVPTAGFQDPLGQGNGSRDATSMHFDDGDLLVLFNVLLRALLFGEQVEAE